MGRVVSGVGVVPQHPVEASLIADSYNSRFKGGMGVHFGLAYLGNLAGPLLGAVALSFLGWRFTLFVFSIPAFVMAISLLWFLGGLMWLVEDPLR